MGGWGNHAVDSLVSRGLVKMTCLGTILDELQLGGTPKDLPDLTSPVR